MSFTDEQIKACLAINQLFESGTFRGDVGKVAVMAEDAGKDDGAGISYGRNQVTENSGGLYALLFEEYAPRGGQFASSFQEYQSSLYHRGGSVSLKGALTNNQAFRQTLRDAGTDPIMGQAQSVIVRDKYMTPALQVCKEMNMRLPLSLAAMFDFFIQSGPGAIFGDGKGWDRIQEWDESFCPGDIEPTNPLYEIQLTLYFIERRHEFLQGIPHAAWTAYRTKTMYELGSSQKDPNGDVWNLKTPLPFTWYREGFRPGWRNMLVRLDQDDLSYQ